MNLFYGISLLSHTNFKYILYIIHAMFLSTISSTYRIENILIIINNRKYIIIKHKLSLVIYIAYQIHI